MTQPKSTRREKLSFDDPEALQALCGSNNGRLKLIERTAGAPPGALAYFKFVPPYDLNACFDRQDPVVTEMVLYHELSHYVQKLIAEDFKMPHWPGEGISEYYGGAVWNEVRHAGSDKVHGGAATHAGIDWRWSGELRGLPS